MTLFVLILGALVLAAFADAAAEYGTDSRALVDDTRHIPYGVGLN